MTNVWLTLLHKRLVNLATHPTGQRHTRHYFVVALHTVLRVSHAANPCLSTMAREPPSSLLSELLGAWHAIEVFLRCCNGHDWRAWIRTDYLSICSPPTNPLAKRRNLVTIPYFL